MNWLLDILLSAIPAFGFAIVFNVPVRVLPYCALLGGIGHCFRTIMISAGVHIEWASLLAAFFIGIVGVQWSKWLLAHPKVFTVAAVIPMFPGIYAYSAMIELVNIARVGYSEALFASLISNFSKAVFIVGALSIGLSLPGLWLYRKDSKI